MTIVVVSTGGTIMAREDPRTGRLVPTATAAEIVELMDWPQAPTLEVEDFTSVPSWDLHGELAARLARRVIEHARRDDVTGVVVPHGTDTMEENVYLVDLVHDAGTPVVFTGAQRPASDPDSDGPRNLRDAIRVAGSPAARGRGAMLAFAGSVHAAREARKVHTSAPAAFASPGYGPIGHVDGEVVLFGRRPDERAALGLDVDRIETRVDLIRLYAGSDARFLDAAVASGARAIVLEATGRGNANDAVVAAVRAATAARVVVVVASRCAEGRVEPVYGRGGGADLAEAGALFAGDLAGPKTRILLQLALGAGVDPADALAAQAS
ncbi:MAG: L-asparaginase [Solirubrobacteraceae bacterium]|nr:L-asparaginase [Solirubrobacteraceae bacterium]MEA2290110.1 L-asparaginase [Solirubrobacteraceae bacterium]